MESVSNSGDEPASWDELYNIDLMPSELFLKFRKEVEGIRVGLNLEFYNAPSNEYQAKFVLKPLSPARRWKFMYEPLHHDVRLVSKKIPVTKYLNLQFSVACYWMEMEALDKFRWRWHFADSKQDITRIVSRVPLRFGWRAEYVLPEIQGAVGTGEPLFNMNSGKLQASLDRVEAIITHSDDIF